MFCSNCGFELPNSANFCSTCGAELSLDKEKKQNSMGRLSQDQISWESNLHLILLPFTVALGILDVVRLMTAGVGIYYGIKEYNKEDKTEWSNRKIWIVVSLVIHAIYIPAILFS